MAENGKNVKEVEDALLKAGICSFDSDAGISPEDVAPCKDALLDLVNHTMEGARHVRPRVPARSDQSVALGGSA